MHQYTWLWQRFEDRAKRAAKVCRSVALRHKPFGGEIVESLMVKRLKAELPGRYGDCRIRSMTSPASSRTSSLSEMTRHLIGCRLWPDGACTIALTYLELAVPSFGLGARWAGYFNAAANMWPPMQKLMGLPEGHVSFKAMMVDYPKYRYQRLPIRNVA